MRSPGRIDSNILLLLTTLAAAIPVAFASSLSLDACGNPNYGSVGCVTPPAGANCCAASQANCKTGWKYYFAGGTVTASCQPGLPNQCNSAGPNPGDLNGFCMPAWPCCSTSSQCWGGDTCVYDSAKTGTCWNGNICEGVTQPYGATVPVCTSRGSVVLNGECCGTDDVTQSIANPAVYGCCPAGQVFTGSSCVAPSCGSSTVGQDCMGMSLSAGYWCPVGICCASGTFWNGVSCVVSCGDTTCQSSYGENVSTCSTDCLVGVNPVCPGGTLWNSTTGYCEPLPTVCDSTQVGNSCAGLTPTSGYYCSRGQTNALPAPGFCCAVGSYFTGAVCQATNACDFNNVNYCGPTADTMPGSIATYVTKATCIGLVASGNKPAGLNACCQISGGKFGQIPYYDWTDANGVNAGAVIY